VVVCFDSFLKKLLCAKLNIMKRYLNNLIILGLFGLFLAVSYLYIPPSATKLNQQINQSPLLSSDIDRINAVSEYGAYLADSLPENVPKLYFYWISKQRKLSDLRIRRAVGDIKKSQITPNELKIWSLLNMGVVIKTTNHTIAVDTANLPFSNAHNELVRNVDIFLITHMDNDHYDPALLKKALAQNKTVIVPENFFFDNNKPDNLINAPYGKAINIGTTTITAYQTDHRGDGNFNNPNAWYVIESDGFKLLHTGDGRTFKDKEVEKKLNGMKDFDILLANFQIHPFNIRDLNPKTVIPLHLYKFMSGKDLYQESTIETVQNTYQRYNKDLEGIKKVYLLPCESYDYR